VTFILNWLPNVEFSGLWIAQKFGWWKQAGLQLAFKPYANGVNPEQDVPERGGNTFGFQSGAAIAIAASKGIPDVALYTDTQKSVFGLTVLKKSGITNLRQLKGKKVGYQPHELYVPEAMLADVGLTAGRDYRTVPVLFDISQLTSGNVDAYLVFVTNEPIALQMQGVGARTFPAANYGFHFYDDVMFTTKSLIQSNPGLVRKVTSIVAKGFKWAHSHPQQAAQYTVQHYFPASTAGSGVTAAQNLQQQKLEAQAFTPYSRDSKGHFSGLMSTSYWRDSINTLFKYHLITSKPNPATIYTNSFNPYR
jgi:ABC-type nitrate/sulfonate/bicarbonate transport system substrate-binding protein